MATTYYTDIQKLYVAYFGRPADVEGLNYWEGVVEGAKGSTAAVSAAFAASAEYKAAFNGMTASAVVTQVYANLFGTTPDTAGLAYWSNLLATGQLSINNIVKNIADGALGADKTAYANKVTAAMAFTAQLDTTAEINGYAKPGAAKDAKAFISGVTTDASLAQAINPATLAKTVENVIAAANGGTTFSLTSLQDSLAGTEGNDTFNARIFDNQNTYQSGDRVDGGAGNADRLNIDVANSQKFAITGETTGVEQFSVRAQAIPVDTNNNNLSTNIVQIDAQRMVGVNYWENSNSRADVVIEDVRILDSQITRDITIAMVETDPGHVDFGFYFDQYSLRAQSNSSATLALQLMDTRSQAAGTGPLKDSPYNGFAFLLTAPGSISAKLVTVQSAAIDNAQTYAELVVAINAALQANPETRAFTASLGGEFTVSDTLGTLQKGTTVNVTATDGSVVSTDGPGTGWVAAGAVPPSSGLHTRMAVDRSTTTELVTSKIILDDVGRGSTGGDLVVGGLSVGDTSSSQGVQRFEIEVRDNSKLQTINSTNNTLREVTIKNGLTSSGNFAYQDTTVNEGNLTVNGAVNTEDTVKNNTLPGSGPQHNAYGFSDVRLIDATDFKGKLAFSAEITAASIGKYLNLRDIQALPAGDNIAVVYTGGNDNDTFNIVLDTGVAGSRNTISAGREDFTFTTNGGAGNDTINVRIVGAGNSNGGDSAWYTNQKLNANVFINGGDGNDTITKPGAGDAIITGGTGNDTIYADNTGAQAGNAVSSAIASASAAAYRVASAAELANAITNVLAADATNAGVLNARAASLTALDAATFVGAADGAVTAATTAAVAAGAITAAQKTAIDTAYTADAGAVVVAADNTAGDAIVTPLLVAARAAAAAATAADNVVATYPAILSGSANAVVAATLAINGLAGSGTKVANLSTLQAAITVGATDAAVAAATAAAVANGAILAGDKTAIDAAAASVGAGNVDAVELAATVALIAPLQAAATVVNTTNTTTLNNAITANTAFINGSTGAYLTSAQADNAAAVIVSTAAANAVTATNAQIAALTTLKAATVAGTLDYQVGIATTAAVAAGVISAGDKTAIDGIANGTAAPMTPAEKTQIDAIIDPLYIPFNATLAAQTITAATTAATTAMTATALQAATAASLLNAGGLSVSAAKAIYVLNTANQAASYDLATNDERNAADLKSDVNNTYNLFNSRLTVNFLGLEAVVNVDSTAYRTTDLQINQAIKNAINNDPVLSKLLTANDGPANTLVVTSRIDGVLSTDDLSITLATPAVGTLTAGDIAAAASAYGFVGTATEATLIGAGGLMTLAKASFDTKGDYVDQLAETGAAGSAAVNVNITGADSLTTSDNTITGGTGNDVIVLGTTLGIDQLNSSNDRVVFNAAGFGNDTIVNFSVAGNGVDTLDFTGLKGFGSATFGSFSANNSIVVAAETVANDTAAEIAALFTDSATVQDHVYIAYDAVTNIAKVYTVADSAGVAVGSVTATLVGTVDLADTGWGTLTAANFA